MHFGELAHLARALAWQARGGRFESDILHQRKIGCLEVSKWPFLCQKGFFEII